MPAQQVCISISTHDRNKVKIKKSSRDTFAQHVPFAIRTAVKTCFSRRPTTQVGLARFNCPRWIWLMLPTKNLDIFFDLLRIVLKMQLNVQSSSRENNVDV
jgi:hypothetical protein